MRLAMNREDWQQLAIRRVADAKALLKARRWSAAYYLTGYALECGLKSCILARLSGEAEVIFEEKRYSVKCWTHLLSQLLELAGLQAALATDAVMDPDLSRFWDTAKEWRESSRYTRKSKIDAEELVKAVADRKHGVLQWLKKHW